MNVKCYNCFQDYDDTESICPNCGYERNSAKREPNHLPRGTILNDRYIIGEVCGFGGFGITYKSWDSQLEMIVAVKEYFPNGSVNRIPGTENVVLFTGNRLKEFNFGLERFIEEARITAKYVSNKNIVNVFNYFEANKTAYIVMEYLDGITLEKFLLQSDGEKEILDIDTAVDITLSICNALRTIHADGVVHRDVSPDNIYICYNGLYKLYDFGAARFSQDENRLTIILKPGYAPPEQYEQVNAQGPWTDIYALGATLYEMVTGEKPVESTNRKIEDILKEPSEINPEIPQYLNDAILKAMAIEPHLRFQNVEEFEQVLKKEKPVESPKVTVRKKKKKRLVGISAMAAVLLVGAGIFAIRLNKQRLLETLPEGEIDVWYVNDNTALSEALNEIKDEFCENYEGVSINLIGLESEDYGESLQKARDEGNMPVLFQSDDMDISEFSVLPIKTVFENISADSYYFLSDDMEQISSVKKFPLGFNVPVFYINTSRCDYSEDSVEKLSDIIDENGTLSIYGKDVEIFKELFSDSLYKSAEVEDFYNGEADVLFADTSCFYDIQSALPARFKMLYVDGNSIDCCYSNCWSMGDNGDEDDERIAERFLEFMLSDNSQDFFYIRHKNNALPINKKAFEVYKEVYSEFGTLTADGGKYVPENEKQ